MHVFIHRTGIEAIAGGIKIRLTDIDQFKNIRLDPGIVRDFHVTHDAIPVKKHFYLFLSHTRTLPQTGRDGPLRELCYHQGMKAQVLVRYGQPEFAFELREVPVPEPGPEQILIQVEGFGLNFADVMARLGLYQDAPPLPAVLGYDVVGRISQIGSKVEDFRIGDRVVALTRFGGYAEYAVGSPLACAKIGDSISIAEATALATQFCTAQYMIEKRMRIMPGDRLLIHSGAGGVGSALIQLAKLKGAYVITTVGSADKAEFAKRLGADEVILYRETDFKEAIEAKHGKQPIQAAFDAIGGAHFRKSLSLVAPAGIICAYGVAENTGSKSGKLLTGIKTLLGFGVLSPPLMMMNGRSFVGVNMLRVADHQPRLFQEILNELVALLASGKIRPLVDPISDGEFPVKRLAEAHAHLESGRSIGKLAIRIQPQTRSST
jgi:NADPH:quinone reductase-like Zn-dependent oxidoreductase